MSMQTNLKDVGWMCHVVPLRKNKAPQPAPPISQIPSIGFMPEDAYPEKKHTMYFKSTDSPYVQLSKMGGRPDLLCFKENERNRGPPTPYCRCEWYYLEDNALEDKQNRKEESKHVFKVPFYMSDISVCPTKKKEITKPIVSSTPPPLQKPKKLKKCCKLPSHRIGYAEYNRKPTKISIAKYVRDPALPIVFPKSDVTKCNPTNFSKLLAHEYTSDYDFYQKQWKEVKNYYKSKGDPCVLKNSPFKKTTLGPVGNDVKL
ncbi:unnamed protein product [Trichobilharzia szidati]|nr:unnamed protein product [Trichobilharzia szidati]